jgi:hypothetical protein
MAISWPDNLPFGIKYGATTEIGRGSKIITDMDYGNKRRRRRFTNVPTYQSVTIKFNDEQLEQFVYFYRSTLMNGTLSFYAKVIVGENIETRRCSIDDETLNIEHMDYNYNQISFTLEIYDITGLADGSEWLLALYGEHFVLNTLHDPLQYEVNVHLPLIYADIPQFADVGE